MAQHRPLRPGDELPAVELGALTADDLARYAEASGDHNPLHLRPEAARAAGFPDVIAHGMFVMGLMSRVVAELAGDGVVRSFQSRFVAPTALGEPLRCGGQVAGVEAAAPGVELVTLALWVEGPGGSRKAVGEAAIERAVGP
jgi:acyl dehydratase